MFFSYVADERGSDYNAEIHPAGLSVTKFYFFSRVQRLEVENALEIAAGHAGSGPAALPPIPSFAETLVCRSPHCLHLAALWILIVVLMPHTLQLSGFSLRFIALLSCELPQAGRGWRGGSNNRLHHCHFVLNRAAATYMQVKHVIM